MSQWWCCCEEGGCCYVEDTFCRDDTGDPNQGVLGGLWEVVSGIWYIDGGYCGDVGYDYECAECENNNPACTLQVKLGGIKATDPEDCADCLDLNGSHNLTYQGNCLWQKTLGAAVCGVTTIDATLVLDGGDYILTITAGDSTWTVNLGTDPPSCIEFDKVALSPDVSASNCDNSSSGCGVSAVVTSDLDCTGPETPFVGSHLGGSGAYSVLGCTYEYPGCSNAVDGDASSVITMTLTGIIKGDGIYAGAVATCDDITNDTGIDSLGSNRTYEGVTTTGGSGSGLTVDVTIFSGFITAVTVNNPGTGYVVGETITISGLSAVYRTKGSPPNDDGTCRVASLGGASCVNWNNGGEGDDLYELIYQGGSHWKAPVSSSDICGEFLDLRLSKSSGDYILTATVDNMTWVGNLGSDKPVMTNFSGVSLLPVPMQEGVDVCYAYVGDTGITIEDDGTYRNIATAKVAGGGDDALTVSVTVFGGVITSITVGNNAGTGYAVGDVVTLCGLNSAGCDGANDDGTFTVGTILTGCDATFNEFQDDTGILPDSVYTCGKLHDDTGIDSESDGTYCNVTTTKVTGSGNDQLTVDVTITDGEITGVVVGDNAGLDYTLDDRITLTGLSAAGCPNANDDGYFYVTKLCGGTNGTYYNVATTKVTGSGDNDLTVTVTVAGGKIVAVIMGDDRGTGYKAGDTIRLSGLSAAGCTGAEDDGRFDIKTLCGCNNAASTCTVAGVNFGVHLRVDGWAPANKTWRAIINYVDANNYWIVEVKHGDGGLSAEGTPTKGALRIIQRSDDSETTIAEEESTTIHGRDTPACGSYVQDTGTDKSGPPYDDDGTYYNVTTTGGSGTGLTVDLHISSGVITNIILANPGSDYEVGNTITLSGLSAAGCSGANNDGRFTLAAVADLDNQFNRLYICLRSTVLCSGDDPLADVLYAKVGSIEVQAVSSPQSWALPLATSRWVALSTGDSTANPSSRFDDFCLLKPTLACSTNSLCPYCGPPGCGYPIDNTVTWFTHEVEDGIITRVNHEGPCYTYYVNSVSGNAEETGSGTELDPWVNLNTVFGSNCIYGACTTSICPKVKVLVKGTIDYAVGGGLGNYNRKLIIEPWGSERIAVDVAVENAGTIGVWAITNCVGCVWKCVDATSTSTAGIPGKSYSFHYCSSSTFDACTGTGTGNLVAYGGGHGFYHCSSSTFDACTGTGAGSSYGYGFYYCLSSTFDACIGTGTGSSYGHGFYYCPSSAFDACTGTGNATLSGRGFSVCLSSTFDACIGTGTGSSYGVGFFDCRSSTFDTCTGTGNATGPECKRACGFNINTDAVFSNCTTSDRICEDCSEAICDAWVCDI